MLGMGVRFFFYVSVGLVHVNICHDVMGGAVSKSHPIPGTARKAAPGEGGGGGVTSRGKGVTFCPPQT